MVRINRLTRGIVKGTVLAKIETFNPGNSIKDRMAVKMIEDAEKRGPAQAGRHDHRRHLGQYRHGPRHRRRRQGLPLHLHDHRQAVEGKSRRAEGVRRRGDRLSDQRRPGRSALVLLGVVAARARGAELVEGEPVRQPVELAGALRADRSRDLGADRRHGDAAGGRRRHRRHDFRRRPLPQGAQPEDQGVGHRHLRVGLQEVQGDRRLRQARDLSRTSPKGSARTSCRRTSISRSSTTSRRSPTRTRRS